MFKEGAASRINSPGSTRLNSLLTHYEKRSISASNRRYCPRRVGAGLMGKTGTAWKGGIFVFPEANRRILVKN
jgi:hypothetical protein